MGFVIFIYFIIYLAPLIIGCAVMGIQKKVKFIHEKSGVKKDGFIGYSWTYFFFGFFVPIFRGEIAIGTLHLLLSLITFGIFQLIMPFLYNKQYSTRLLTSGWQLNDNDTLNTLAKLKLNLN